MTITEYSATRIGEVWTYEDHEWLETQLLKIEWLAQGLLTLNGKMDGMRRPGSGDALTGPADGKNGHSTREA